MTKKLDLVEVALKYYNDHREELLSQYEGKVLVIADDRVFGAYDSDTEALTEATKKYKLGEFLVHKCVVDEDENVAIFHSRVSFA